MNAKTLEAINRHGESLLKAFPNCTEKNPVALCKKLRRIETSLARPLVDYCNGDATIEAVDKACENAEVRVVKLLGEIPTIPINASGSKCADCFQYSSTIA